MTKRMVLGSIEHGARRAFALLGNKGVEAAIRDRLGLARSGSLIRKCGDPDDDNHHLQLRYAVALDAACAEAGHAPPLLDVHRSLVERMAEPDAARGQASKETVVDAVIVLQAVLGDLAGKVRYAFDPESEDDGALTQSERHMIFEAIDRLEREAETLKKVIVAA